MVLVLAFVMLFVSLLGVVWRREASALRIASVRTLQSQRDEGCIKALARALRLLETGNPPSTPYICAATVDVMINGVSTPRSYTITFTQESAGLWSVHSILTPAAEHPTPMPDDFGPS